MLYQTLKQTLLAVSLLLVGTAFGAAQAAPKAVLKVVPADAPAIQKAIAAQKGKVVLVNFWATWCAPCVAEFPAIVHTGRTYHAQGLRVLAVSADFPKDRKTKVVSFLQKQGAAFPCFLQKSADPEQFINAFDPSWSGELPRTLIYDRSGRLVKSLSGEQTAQTLAAAVQPYLTKSPAK